jgi:hypothetical protein
VPDAPASIAIEASASIMEAVKAFAFSGRSSVSSQHRALLESWID